MTALELLEELERQIIEWGYINANTTLLFKIKDAIKELESYCEEQKDTWESQENGNHKVYEKILAKLRKNND